MSRILREYYEKKRLRLPEWLFDGDTPRVARKKSVVQHQDLYVADNNGPVRTPSRRRLWEQNPSDPKNISSRERERQELRQAQPPPPPVPSNARNDRYHEEDRYQRDNNYRDTRPSNRYNHEPPQLDTYYQRSYDDQPKSPNRRYYDNDQPPPLSAPRSDRSARGYLQRDPPPQRVTAAHHQQYDRGNDLDDYYYNNDSARDRLPPRREPSLRSGGRRYGNDPSYF